MDEPQEEAVSQGSLERPPLTSSDGEEQAPPQEALPQGGPAPGSSGPGRVPSSVVVAVRARPLGAEQGAAAIEVQASTVTISPGKSERAFAFDHAYDGRVQQEIVYRDLGAPILRKALQGFNATIFAYGQTGSGKSHTMMGTPNDAGIIPRMGEELFFCVDKSLEESPGRKFLLTCSYLEIYNEVLQDLLLPPKKAPREALEIKEHPTLGVHVKGLLELPVRSRSDILRLLEEGNSRRATGETKMNARSSRSHSIFSIRIQQQEALQESEQKKEVWSKINLVDLAGSERAGKTGAEGARLREGICINQSLSALGAVITALAESARKGKMQYVPYRNSKLTRVLQESLGGNALTVMVATISSAASNMDESSNTLHYAERAKCIQVKATRNEQLSEVGQLREQLEVLRRQLATQVGVARTEEEEEQLRSYRSQIEEYELRLQQSFEEKERACTELAEQVHRQWEQLVQQRRMRRMQAAERGDWLQALAPGDPAWAPGFLEELSSLLSKQREAEAKVERCGAFVAFLLATLEDSVSQLEAQVQDARSGAAADLSKTIDMASSQGDVVLARLCRGEEARLQQCKQVALRRQGLLEQLRQFEVLRRSCGELYQEAKVTLLLEEKRKQVSPGEQEAVEDLECARDCLQRKLVEASGQGQSQLLQCAQRLLSALQSCLKHEAEKLSCPGSRPESEGATQQRWQRQLEATEAVAQLEAMHEGPLNLSSNDFSKALDVLQRCLGQRLLQERRSNKALPLIQEGGSEAASPAAGGEADDYREAWEQAKQELKAARLQNQQMLTVISCQAASLAEGSGHAAEREQMQLRALAEQVQELGELRQLLLAERQEAQSGERELLVQAELGEARFQQTRQLRLSEQLLDDHAQQVSALREEAERARRRNLELEQQVCELGEQLPKLQSQVEQQAAELSEARALEQKFASLAADMGCVDEQGRLMQQELQRVTAELLRTKASEAEYHQWLQDVKAMLASGREDGLAMALAENMEQCRRKDRVIQMKEEELRQLRMEKARQQKLLRQQPPSAPSPAVATADGPEPDPCPQRDAAAATPPPAAWAESSSPSWRTSLSQGLLAQGAPAVASRGSTRSGSASQPVRGGSVPAMPRAPLPRTTTPRPVRRR